MTETATAPAPVVAPAPTAAPTAPARDEQGRFAPKSGSDEFDVRVRANEADDDKALEAVFARHGLNKDTPKAAPVEAAPAKEKTVEAPDAKSESTAVSEATGDVNAAKVASGDTDAHERALTALRRANVPKKVIESLSKEDAIEMATPIAKAQAFTDNLVRENSELKKPKTNETAPEKTETALAVPPVDLKRLVAPIVEAYGEEAGDAVVAVANEATKPLLAELSASKAALGNVSGLVEALLLDSAQQRLGERFPMLKDAANFAKAVEKAKTLIATGHYSSPSDPISGFMSAMTDATRLLFSDVIEADVRARAEKTNSLISNGTPSTASQKTPTSSMSLEDRETALAMDLLQGVPKAEAARKWGFAG